MKTKNLNFLLAALLAFGLSACGDAGKTEENKDNTTTENKGGEGKKESTELGDKSKCGSTSISFDSKKVSGAGFEAKYAAAKLHEMQSDGKKYPSVWVLLANYEKEGSYLQEPKTEGQRRVILSFNGVSGQSLAIGSYNVEGKGFGADASLGGGIGSKDANVSLSNGKGMGEITYISVDKICGTYSIEDAGGTVIKGSFSVPLER